jgi:hypothetical protein
VLHQLRVKMGIYALLDTTVLLVVQLLLHVLLVLIVILKV